MSDFCLLQVVVQAVLVFGQVCKPGPGVLLFVLVFVLFLVRGWGDDLFHLLLHFCLAAKFFVLFFGRCRPCQQPRCLLRDVCGVRTLAAQ